MEVNRRHVMKLAATAGAVATGGVALGSGPNDDKDGRSRSLAAKYPRVEDFENFDTRGTNYKLPIFKEADKTALAGRRVLIISADGPELPELDVPMEYLKSRGACVELAGQDWVFHSPERKKHIVIAQWLADNICIKADLSLKDVAVAKYDPEKGAMVTNYDAVFIPGGAWNPDMLRTDGDALRVVREARANGVLIISLCHGPQVLINAARSDPDGQVVFPRGTHITGVRSIRVDLDNAGFTVLDKPTVYDPVSRLLTARDPNDLGPLCEEMGRLLSKPVSP
jgi:protease I